MSRIVQRTRRDLREIANRASISSTARETILARAEDPVEHREEVVMLEKNHSAVPRPAWSIVAAIAAVVAIVVGAAVLISLRGDDGEVAVTDMPAIQPADTGVADQRMDDPEASHTDVDETPTGTEADTPVATMPDWHPALAGVTASDTPPPATCPAGAQESLGPIVEVPDFMELGTADPFDAKAVFDPSSHSIVVIRRGGPVALDPVIVAGRLDVCSGTWSPMSADFGTNADGVAVSPQALVYDEDSAALVAFTPADVRVYDPTIDEWLPHPDASVADVNPWESWEGGLKRAFYHPASGMIIVEHIDSLYAYDVDQAAWHSIQRPLGSDNLDEFLGINAELDRFVYAEGVGTLGADVSDVTRLVDPVTGVYTDIATPGRPVANVYNGFGPFEAVGQIDGTVYVSHLDEETICGFNGQTLAWDLCTRDPRIDTAPIVFAEHGGEWAIVGDPISDQLIAVPPSGVLRTTPLP